MQQLTLLDEFQASPLAISSLSDLMTNQNMPPEVVADILEGVVADEMDGMEMSGVQAIPESDPTMKWVNSSSFQKCLRRGLQDDALRYGLSYNLLDPSGFWRRLIVIAFEDCGLANPMGVALTLILARNKTLRRKLGGDTQVITYIVRLLTGGIKSRTVCDYIQALSHAPRTPDELDILSNASFDELAGIVLSEQDLDFRAAAASVLWGTDRYGFENRQLPYRAGSREVFFDTIEQTRIQSLIKFVARQGVKSMPDGMAVVFPFMWQLLASSPWMNTVETLVPAVNYIKGKPDFGYDKHVRSGKESFLRFYLMCKPIQQWFNSQRIFTEAGIIKAIGICVFASESTLLDKQLVFQGSEEIYQQTLRNDYVNYGLTPEEGRELTKLIEDNAEILRRARQVVVEGNRR